MGVPTPRTAVQRGRSVEERLEILEQRTASALPGRLAQTGQEVDDWDDAIRVGFYWSADGYVGTVLASPAGLVQQRQLATPAQSRMETRSFDGLTWSPWRREDGLWRGTALERSGITPAYWDFWQDTDGTEKLYVGSKTGTWRQFCGEATVGVKAWDTSSAPFYLRTDVVSIATKLETSETLALSPTSGGSGYSAFMMVGLVRNPTTVDVTTRLSQFVSSTTQAYTFAWSIQQK